jgi:DNA-binding GntR family transcriptional regulator
MEALPRQISLVESVYEAIRDSICDGLLKPGERITQEGIADRLDVSRQPVGQALVLLRSQGFIQDAGRRGVMVSPLEQQTVRDIYEIRGALDQLAAQLAAKRNAKQLLEDGHRLIGNVRENLDGASTTDLVKADMDFHELIYRHSGNGLIQPSLGTYWHHLRRVMAAVIAFGYQRERIWSEHEGILLAIGEGDGNRATELAKAHVDRASQSLSKTIEDSLTASAEGRGGQAS